MVFLKMLKILNYCIKYGEISKLEANEQNFFIILPIPSAIISNNQKF